MVFATTWTGTVPAAAPVRAVIVARPGATALRTPSADTFTTPGAELFQVKLSSRLSPACEKLAAVSRSRCPATSLVTCGATAIRAAGPGTICTSTRWITGLVPVTLACTLTASVPVEPDRMRPVESTVPSKRPPAPKNRMVASGTGCPSESSARAVRRSVSPAGIWSEVPGRTSRRAIGEAARGSGGSGLLGALLQRGQHGQREQDHARVRCPRVGNERDPARRVAGAGSEYNAPLARDDTSGRRRRDVDLGSRLHLGRPRRNHDRRRD